MTFFYWLREKVSNRLSLLHKPIMRTGYLQNGKWLKNVRISNTTFIHAKDKFVIGDHVFIGHYNFIEASNGLTIEEGCQITNYVSITTHSSHISIRLYGVEYSNFQDLKGYIKGPVTIGKYSYIGPHTVIMPNTKIGKGSVVAAFSYVKGDFPDFSIIAGNPAKVIGDTRQLDEPYLKENHQLRTFYDKWVSQK
ncbi:MAG: hypothetical protein Fur0028_02490 [Bacteroidales bacterium]